MTKPQTRNDVASETLLGFRIGQVVVASHDITAGLYQPTVLCRKGTRLRVVGPSGNGLHPIGCCKVKDKHWNIAVSVCDIEKPNIPAETRPASGRSLQPMVGTERKER